MQLPYTSMHVHVAESIENKKWRTQTWRQKKGGKTRKDWRLVEFSLKCCSCYVAKLSWTLLKTHHGVRRGFDSLLSLMAWIGGPILFFYNRDPGDSWTWLHLSTRWRTDNSRYLHSFYSNASGLYPVNIDPDTIKPPLAKKLEVFPNMRVGKEPLLLSKLVNIKACPKDAVSILTGVDVSSIYSTDESCHHGLSWIRVSLCS